MRNAILNAALVSEAPTAERPAADQTPRLAYVLKAYPRASEPFILSEIHRLETLGVALRLFAVKPAEPADRIPRHAVIDLIRAVPEYLTETGSTRSVSAMAWLRQHFPRFWPAWKRVARRHPWGMAQSVAMLFAELARSRRTVERRVKRTLLREFLHAVELVDRLASTPSIRHLHAHYAHGATSVVRFATRMRGGSFSFTGHAKDLYADSANRGGALRRKLDAARFVVTCTEANRQMLKALAPSATVHRFYHGLNADFSALLESRTPPLREDRRFRILGVGRLVRKKGFDLLIEAAALMVGRGIPLEVAIVGPDGDHAGEVRQLIAERGLGSIVSFMGPQDQQTLFDEYHRAHVFCLPCRVLDDGDRDGIPNVLLEAMACGTPVVTTPVSGIPELVRHESNGLLVEPDSAVSLADALTRAYSEPLLRHRLGEAARRAVDEQFAGDRQAARLASLFLETVL